MTFIPTPNCARAAIKMGIGTRPIVNVMWFEKTSPFSQSDCDNLASNLLNFWRDHMLPNFAGACGLESCTVYAQDADNSPMSTSTLVPVEFGGHTTGSDLAANAALCLSFYSQNRGRSGRGRIYLGMFNSDQLASATVWSTALCTAILSDIGELATHLAPFGMTHVVVSHFHNKVARSQGLAQGVVRYDVHNRVDSMRRRLGRQA